jgi:hypothetical protein
LIALGLPARTSDETPTNLFTLRVEMAQLGWRWLGDSDVADGGCRRGHCVRRVAFWRLGRPMYGPFEPQAGAPPRRSQRRVNRFGGNPHGSPALRAPCSECSSAARGHGIASLTPPATVSAAAVSKAGDVPDEDLVRAEAVPVRAARRWTGDPTSRPSSSPLAPRQKPSSGLLSNVTTKRRNIPVRASLVATNPAESMDICIHRVSSTSRSSP